jgi:hypothetical protein
MWETVKSKLYVPANSKVEEIKWEKIIRDVKDFPPTYEYEAYVIQL